MSQKETTLSKAEIECIVDEMISKKKTIKTKIYKIVNIFVDANGCRLYDINKISQVDARSYEGYGSSEINSIVNDSSLKNNSHKDKK